MKLDLRLSKQRYQFCNHFNELIYGCYAGDIFHQNEAFNFTYVRNQPVKILFQLISL